ncbi:MAG: relaxase MobL [Oscillospiraceae bacterium]|nr:relaxase MobL [Oscillospiraceae bacterium]
MARLILKSPYIKGGARAASYAKYIGTRERVELVPDGRPASKKQEQLIASLVKDFPGAKKLPEYSEYYNSPTKVNASAFITQALEDNWSDAQQSDIYAEYIATRPRVERFGSHGLFGDEDYVDLKNVTAELQNCEKNVWTHIVSLKREDAARLGYDNARAWRNLIRTHRNDIAAAMNIPPNNFRWYAAFHDEGDHPHIHMMAWSVGDAPGYLSKIGIQDIKSALTNDIFRQEILHVYELKSQSRDELVAEARRTMLELAGQMKHGICEHPEAEQMLLTLAHELKSVKGKKQYGYLPKRIKKQVDEIVDQMARLPSVKSCYEKWLELQQEVNGFYSDKPMERTSLSQQKEFRAIHNAVVQAAVQMGQITFEDKGMERFDEPDDVLQNGETCGRIWSAVCDGSLPLDLRDEGVERLRTQAEGGDPHAQLLLGRLYRDGPLLTPDSVEARYWFGQAARELPDAQYALGKLLLTDDVEVHDREEGIRWLTRAAEGGHEFAAYRLAKELLREGDVAEALPWLTASAEADNPYAEYLLGKLYWEGGAIPQDMEKAVYWLNQAAEQGHTYAQILLERQDSSSLPSAILAVNNLLHSIGCIFQDSVRTMDSTQVQHTDRKLRRRIQEKKIAMGHKPDDHADQGYIGPAM